MFWLGILLLSAFCGNSLLLGQSDTASITGFVRDPSSAVVPNASVVIRNEATGLERRATTNESGYYIVSSLPAGFYTVSVEAQGFKKFEKTQNKLDPNIASTVDAQLQVGSATETVNVVAEAVAIQSESATIGKVVTQQEIRNIPLNGRNPLFLAMLKPGVQGSNALAQFSFNLTTGGLNINGSRTQDNLITFDGAVAVRTRSNGTSIGTADVDAVQEMQVLTANYNAEYGRAAGGQIRIVTKSGQRDFHGDFYEYFRNSAMNANEWSRNRVENRPDISGRPGPFRFNQFGYALSGPVFIPKVFNTDRNKFFWLFGQEYVRFRQEQLNATNGIRVPTALMRQGNFSELLTAPNIFYNTPQIIRDANGNPYPNNIIPASQLSRNGLALLRSFPEPNTTNFPGANNFQARSASQNQRKDTYSFDYVPFEAHYFRFRYQQFELVDRGAFRGNTDRAPSTLDRPNRTASLNYIWTVTPSIVNEALVTASVDRVRILVNPDAPYQRSLYGINYPYLFPEKEIFDKIPTIEIQNFQTIDGGPYPSSSAGPIYTMSNNLSWIKGNHTIKFGGLFERAGQNDFDQINVQGVPGGTNNQNGRFVFTNTTPGGTGLAIANAAIGRYDTYAELGNRSYTPYRGHMFEFFAQDSWKATSKLRLEYGIRFSRIQPFYSDWGNMLVFDPNRYDASRAYNIDPVTGIGTYARPIDQYNGMVIPGDGWPEEAIGRIPVATSGEFNSLFGGRKEFSRTHNVWQPRLGVAYAFDQKNVLRAAVGRFVTRLGVSDSVFLGGNPPLQPTVSTSNGLVDNPSGAGRVTGFPLTVTTQDPIFNNPEAWTWNVTYQRELPWSTVFEAGYVGRLGLNGQRERNINQLLPGTLPRPGINVDFLRPYRGYGVIRTTNNEARSEYNSLQLSLNRRFSNGFSGSFAYTYAKSYDNGSTQRSVIPNAYDDSMMWGPSNFDRRHVVVANAIYELPFYRNQSSLLGKLIGGWQISLVAQFQTGVPVWIGTTDDRAGVGPGSGNLGENVPPTPWLIVGDTKVSDTSFGPGGQWFNPAAFQRPPAGTFVGPGTRNVVRNPGFQNWTGALFKTFAITERQRITFRSEFYNIPNHPNWGNASGRDGVDVNPESGTFGRVLQKWFERTIQLSLRYSF
jgi:hypothetical protein